MTQPPYPYDPNDPNSWQNPNYQQNPNPYQQNPNPYQQNPYQQNPYGNPYQQNPYQQPYGWQAPGVPAGFQRDLPNATGVLVLGIISILGSFCYAVPGLACGLISLLMANKAIQQYEADPASYSQSGYNNTKAGRICAIIGLCLSAVMLIVFIFAFIAEYERRSRYYDF